MKLIDAESMMRYLFVILALCVISSGSFAFDSKPDFTLPDLDGKEHSLSDYRGKWVVVNYWATWCPPCLEEMPELELFHSEHKDSDAVVLGINTEHVSLEALKKFKEEQLISFPILRSSPSEPGIAGRLTSLPTTYLVDPTGKLVAQQSGRVRRESIEKFIANYEKDGETD